MASPSWFTFRNSSADSLTIDILDEIGMFGVTAKDFANQLRALPQAKAITLNLDCPGGDCNDGFTIYDALVGHGADVTVNITGLAASMASVIMLAGRTVNIAENGRVMIHRVAGGAYGNPDDMDAAARLMKQFEDRIVGLYVAKTGKAESDIRDMMKAQMGTWFFGQDAVDAGFADAVIATKARNFKASWAPMFTMLPAALFDSAAAGMETPSAESPAAAEEPVTEVVAVPAAAPEISPAPEAVVEPETAPAAEAKGIMERIAAAFSGDAAVRAELASARALVVDRDNEIAALRAEVQSLTPKATAHDAIVAQLAEVEAQVKTVGLAAAEIAAAHGLKPDALTDLPAPSDAAPRDVLADFEALTGEAKREFYLANKAAIKAAQAR